MAAVTMIAVFAVTCGPLVADDVYDRIVAGKQKSPANWERRGDIGSRFRTSAGCHIFLKLPSEQTAELTPAHAAETMHGMDENRPQNVFAVWNWPKPVLMIGGVFLVLLAAMGALSTLWLFTPMPAPVAAPAPVITTVPAAGSTTGP